MACFSYIIEHIEQNISVDRLSLSTDRVLVSKTDHSFGFINNFFNVFKYLLSLGFAKIIVSLVRNMPLVLNMREF